MTIHKLEVSPLNNTALCPCGHWTFSCRKETAELLKNLQLRQKSTDAIEAKVLRQSREVRKSFKRHLLQVREALH